jgi:hypothetical protein
MAKYTRKQMEDVKNAANISESGELIGGYDKFTKYHKGHNAWLDEETHGLYKVKHNGKTSVRECVRAAKKDRHGKVTARGWLVSVGEHRSFKPDGAGWEFYPIKK